MGGCGIKYHSGLSTMLVCKHNAVSDELILSAANLNNPEDTEWSRVERSTGCENTYCPNWTDHYHFIVERTP